MNRNFSIVVIILVLAAIAGYLVWLRSKVVPTISPRVEEIQVTPVASATASATPSATPADREATGSVRQTTATPGATRR